MKKFYALMLALVVALTSFTIPNAATVMADDTVYTTVAIDSSFKTTYDAMDTISIPFTITKYEEGNYAGGSITIEIEPENGSGNARSFYGYYYASDLKTGENKVNFTLDTKGDPFEIGNYTIYYYNYSDKQNTLKTKTFSVTSASGTCGSKLKWSINSKGTLTISGKGRMTNYSSSSKTPWYYQRYIIKKVTVKKNVTSIGEYAFANLDALENVSMASTVTSLGEYAFYSDENLHDITIPSKVESLPDGLFYNCNNLISVTLPDTLTKIGSSAFGECDALEKVNFKGSAAMWSNIDNGYGNSVLEKAKCKYSIKSLKTMKFSSLKRSDYTKKNSKYSKIIAKWKKVAGVTGYEVRVSYYKDFSYGVTTKKIKSNKTVSATFNGLYTFYDYYVQIRSYKKLDSGAINYSAWSKVKTSKQL